MISISDTRNTFNKSTCWLLFIGLCLIHFKVSAARIELAETSQGRPLAGITIEGLIEKGNYKEFLALSLATKGVTAVYLASPGGDFLESLKIGKLIRSLKLEVWAPMVKTASLVKLSNKENNICASSCFFIYAGGVSRNGNVIGIHRPYLSEDDYKAMSLTEAGGIHDTITTVVERYLDEMHIPSQYSNRIMAIGSQEVEWLDYYEIKKNLDGFIPAYQEWFSAQCPGITADEERKHAEIIQRLPEKYRSLPAKDIPFNQADKEFVNFYNNKLYRIVECDATLLVEEQDKARLSILNKLLDEEGK